MSVERHAQVLLGLNRAVRGFALPANRARHPKAGEATVRVRLTVRLYGRAAAQRLFSTVPNDAT